MAQTSARLARRVRVDFPPGEAEQVLEHLAGIPETLPLGLHQDAERMQACLVLAADGDLQLFMAQLDLVRRDWRDALVAAGLGGQDWPERLRTALGHR